ncbi:hypothetical protein EJB05_08661, partial [Eragrostis curvula]
MAAAEEWRARIRDRALEAADRFGLANLRLVFAAGHLTPPMHAAGALRIGAAVTENLLEDATSNLAAAASLMAAAKLVALRGAAATPTEPLRSIEEITLDAEPDLRVALGRLRIATTRAGDAFLAVERGRSHMWMAYQLLDFEHLPGVDGFLEAERAAALHELGAAQALAVECNTLARAAYHLLR